MREETVSIDRLAYGGAGFGRIDGKACFVPFAAPGDRARVRIRRETASYAEADLIETLEPASCRITAPCSVFGRCGGCHWQHLAYETQCSAKDEIFGESLWRLARVGREKILPPLVSDQPWGYRSRAQVKLYGRGHEFSLGFFAPSSHYVIDLKDGCPVVHPAINAALGELRQTVEEFPERDRIPQLDLAAGEDGTVVMTVHYIGGRPEKAAEFWRTRHDRIPSITGICLQQGRKSTLTPVSGDQRLSYRVPAAADIPVEMTLMFTGGSFSQVNYRQNRALVRTALEWGNRAGCDRVLDLCCGIGNFTLPFSRHSREVIGLETGEQSVADARHNAGLNGIGTVRFEVLDGAAGLRRLVAARERFDLVILDPPRGGALEMTGLLAELGAPNVLYVSCDPQTLGRDLARLQKGGYRVVKSRVVDMFPQTYHIESITLLERE